MQATSRFPTYIKWYPRTLQCVQLTSLLWFNFLLFNTFIADFVSVSKHLSIDMPEILQFHFNQCIKSQLQCGIWLLIMEAISDFNSVLNSLRLAVCVFSKVLIDERTCGFLREWFKQSSLSSRLWHFRNRT